MKLSVSTLSFLLATSTTVRGQEGGLGSIGEDGGFGGELIEDGGFGGELMEDEFDGKDGPEDRPEETCGAHDYTLYIDDDNRPFGSFTIEDDLEDMLTIVVDIEGQDLDGNNEMYPYVTEVRASACCESSGVCSPTQVSRYHVDEGETPVTQARMYIMEPPCPDGEPVDIRVYADIEEPGGIDAFKAMFPPGGTDVSFTLTRAHGSEEGDSFVDAEFSGSAPQALQGSKFDGYCVDMLHYLNIGFEYTGKAYNFLNIDWNDEDTTIGNIQRPSQMDAVAWCINHYTVGESYAGKVLHSNTLQVAIWLIVDQPMDEGYQNYDEGRAREIADDCMAQGQGFVPGCNDMIPLVLVPDANEDYIDQNQYVQTTFAQLGITCDGRTGRGEAEALCETGGSGTSGGDPHFKTFGGAWFDFHGGCDLLLADFPSFHNGEGITVEVRTTTRYDYSFIESAAIQIGNDILEVSSFGQYLINGISKAALPALVGDFIVEHKKPKKNQHLFTIDLEEGRNIVVKVYKDLIYVDLNIRKGHNLEFHDGVGMLGSYFNGTRYGRDGVTIIKDDIEFGQEWQVRDTDAKLFMTDRAPQWPAKCQMPDPVERASRRLGGETPVSAKEAAEACAHIKNKHSHDMCVFDVLATSDLSVAHGGAY